MTETRKLRVFLCHSSQDKPIVRELYQRLSAEGWVDPWLDNERLLPGQDWFLEIEKTIEDVDAVIVFISNNSVTKEGYVQRELRYVLDIASTKPEETIFIVPIRLENCELPRRLRTWQYVDYFGVEKEKAYTLLAKSLKVKAGALDVHMPKNSSNNNSYSRLENKEIKQSIDVRKLVVNNYWKYIPQIVLGLIVLLIVFLVNSVGVTVLNPQVLWLVSVMLISIMINVALFRILLDNKILRPLTVSWFINILLSVVGCVATYNILANSLYSILFIFFNLLSFLILAYIVKKRDVNALGFGERLLVTLKLIDLQINYVLFEISRGKTKNTQSSIRLTLRYLLSELTSILGLSSYDYPRMCIFVPQKNKSKKFKVVAYSGLENADVNRIEKTFQYGSKAVSLVGHAVNLRKPIIINDLSSNQIEHTQYWAQLSNDESREGSAFVYPIIRGIGSDDDIPLALVCVTCKRKNAFDEEVFIQLMDLLSPKIEMLQDLNDISLKTKKFTSGAITLEEYKEKTQKLGQNRLDLRRAVAKIDRPINSDDTPK